MQFVAVLVRTLRPDKTYDDFVDAWYPDKGFDCTGRGPILARNLADQRELLTLSLFELPDETSLVGARDLRRDRRVRLQTCVNTPGTSQVN